MLEKLKQFDPEVVKAIESEEKRQESHIELIASENFASPNVMAAQGSVMTNKYAEGYPGKRYYGGCQYVDIVERLAIERAKSLFSVDYVNVQPHSGSQANAAAYMAVLEPGDTILGMRLSDGGHLTHGASVNFSGKLYNVVAYGVDDDGWIDYDEMEALAKTYQPKLIITGSSAYSRVIDWQRCRAIADRVGAWLLADIAHFAGLIAAGVYPTPVDYADILTTTTHKTLRGPRGGMIMAKGDRTKLHKKLNSLVFPGLQGGPLMHVIAAKAVAFKEALDPSFQSYQQTVINNAKVMAEQIQKRGYRVVSQGTDSHLFLVDLSDKNIPGNEAEAALESAHLTLNKNTVPNEPRSPFVTSGLRIGTPAMTTRGFGEAQALAVGDWICDVLDHPYDEATIKKVRDQVIDLCQQFPINSALLQT